MPTFAISLSLVYTRKINYYKYIIPVAIKSTIYKLSLNISDLDRQYYQTHELTIACHPSETEQRMMVRVLAFALYANENLTFTKGLYADDEPELWAKTLSGDIELWISLGQVDEKLIKKSLGRSKQVVIVTYAGNKSKIWFEQKQVQLKKLSHLTLINIPSDAIKALATLASRSMDLQCTIQDGSIWLSNKETTINIEPERWLTL